MTWRMEVPGWTPALLNELMNSHHMKAHRLKRRDADQVMTAMVVFGVPRATGPRRVGLTIRSPFRRLPDPDAPLKSLLDALVTAGAIRDDSGEWCRWEVPTFERGPKLTTITLEDIG